MKQIVAVASASTNRNLDRSTACWPSLPDYISSLVHALSTTKMAPRTPPPPPLTQEALGHGAL